MRYNNYTEDLLGLKGTALIKIEEIQNVKHIYLETKLEPKVCPHCYLPTKMVHSYRIQAINDTEIGGLRSVLIKRWEPYILRAFSSGYTNGYTEGCNNKTKVLKRNCYGVRNFNQFRNRILHMMSA